MKRLLSMVAGLALMSGCFITENFPEQKGIERIKISFSNGEPPEFFFQTIEDPVRISALTAFVNANKSGFERPLLGNQPISVRADFYSHDDRNDFGVARSKWNGGYKFELVAVLDSDNCRRRTSEAVYQEFLRLAGVREVSPGVFEFEKSTP